MARAPRSCLPGALMDLLQLGLVGLLGSSVTIMLALGFQLIFSTSRMFHFAYAAVYAIGVYAVYLFSRHGVPLWLDLVLSAVVVLVLTIVMERLVYRRMRHQGASQLAILIASLGMLIILQSLMALQFGNVDLSVPTPSWLSGSVAFGGINASRVRLAELIVDLVTFGLLLLILRRTSFGKRVRAVADDATRAGMLGVEVDRVILGVLLLGTVVLVPIGALAGMDTGITPYASTDVLLLASIIVFVGGLGSLSGTLVVGVMVGILTGVVLKLIPTEWTESFAYALLVATILVRPRGIFFRLNRARAV